MTDEDRSTVFVEGDGGKLGWTCRADGLNVLYLFDQFLAGNVAVQVRFPPDPALPPQEWDVLTGHKGAALPISGVEKFTEQALRSSNIVLRATGRDSGSATVQLPLAGLAEALQKLPCAQPGARKGVAPVAGNEDALYLQGIKFWNDGKSAEAQKTFEDLIKLALNHAKAHYQLAYCYLNQGKRAEAAAEFEAYLRLDPGGEYYDQARQMVAALKR
jgi:tetratricopeptide (TPR) repeat protein